jgi:hypothetical protein
MMDTKNKLLLSLLALLCGLFLSGATLYSLGLWQLQSSLVWPLEGQKAGQASIWGQYPHSFFGASMAVGDVNGDGFDDLMSSASYSSETILAGGDVYVIPGPLAFNQSYRMPDKAALIFQGPRDD